MLRSRKSWLLLPKGAGLSAATECVRLLSESVGARIEMAVFHDSRPSHSAGWASFTAVGRTTRINFNHGAGEGAAMESAPAPRVALRG